MVEDPKAQAKLETRSPGNVVQVTYSQSLANGFHVETQMLTGSVGTKGVPVRSRAKLTSASLRLSVTPARQDPNRGQSN